MFEGYKLRTRGYTHTGIVVVKDAEALKAYNFHPAHQAFVKAYILPNLKPETDMLVLDYVSPVKSKPTFWQKLSPVVHAVLAVTLISGLYHHRNRFF